MPGSDLRRRSRNGPIRSANWRVLVSCTPASIGLAHTRRNAWRLPSSPGITQSSTDHSSVRLFSIGVPVSATRTSLGTLRSALAVPERAFFTCWASSATTMSQPTCASASWLTRMVPYVVSTNPLSSPSSVRPSPWKRRVSTPGANLRTSASQLPIRLAGQTTSTGPS